LYVHKAPAVPGLSLLVQRFGCTIHGLSWSSSDAARVSIWLASLRHVSAICSNSFFSPGLESAQIAGIRQHNADNPLPCPCDDNPPVSHANVRSQNYLIVNWFLLSNLNRNHSRNSPVEPGNFRISDRDAAWRMTRTSFASLRQNVSGWQSKHPRTTGRSYWKLLMLGSLALTKQKEKSE
jgi:hypothetical protein